MRIISPAPTLINYLTALYVASNSPLLKTNVYGHNKDEDEIIC